MTVKMRLYRISYKTCYVKKKLSIVFDFRFFWHLGLITSTFGLYNSQFLLFKQKNCLLFGIFFFRLSLQAKLPLEEFVFFPFYWVAGQAEVRPRTWRSSFGFLIVILVANGMYEKKIYLHRFGLVCQISTNPITFYSTNRDMGALLNSLLREVCICVQLFWNNY